MTNTTDLRSGIKIISDEVDGATAVAHAFDTSSTYSTSGSQLLRLSNNGTSVFEINWQGGISFKNSGATGEHQQSINLNWVSSGSDCASGQYSTVIGTNNLASGTRTFAQGDSNDVSGNSSFAFGSSNDVQSTHSGAFGENNQVTANYSFGFGNDSLTANSACISLGGTAFANQGDAQTMWATLKVATTDATQTTMQAAATNFVIPADTSWVFSALVVGRSDEADGNDSAAYMLEGCIARDEAGTTALVGSVTKTVIAESAGATAWDATAEAETTAYEGLAVKVTGEASTNIRWVCRLDVAQVSYA